MTDDLWIGEIIAEQYRVDQLIGVGAVGRVYRAQHMGLGLDVAIKFLHGSYGSYGRDFRRFELESQAASCVRHPNVVSILDCGLEPQPFIVMELVSGQSLSQLLADEEKLDWRVAVELASQLASALGAVHGAGFVHRDFKPSNVLIYCGDERKLVAKLSDFGLAKVVSAESTVSRLTLTGEVLGSPPYMSPEQWAGDVVDARSDFYSFGCVLFEMLTGQLVFAAKDPLQYLQMHMNSAPPRLKLVGVDTKQTKHLQLVLDKTLDKNSDCRYDSALELVEDLKLVALGKAPKFACSTDDLSDAKKRQNLVLFLCGFVALLSTLIIVVVSLNRQEIQVFLWQSCFDQGQKAMERGDFVTASKHLEDALNRAGTFSRTDFGYLRTLRSLLKCYQHNNNVVKVQETQELLDRAIGSNVSINWQTSYNRASQYLYAGQLSKAIFEYQSSQAEAEKFGPYSSSLALTLTGLSKAHLLNKDYEASASCARKALSISQRLFEQNDISIASALANLAWPLSYSDKCEEANLLYEQAIEIADSSSETKPTMRAQICSSRAANFLRWGHAAEAEKLYTELEEQARLLPEAEGRKTYGTICNNLSEVYRSMGNPEKARYYLKKAIAISEKFNGPNHGDNEMLYHNLALQHIQRNQLYEAKSALEEAIRLRLVSGPRHPSLVADYADYARVLRLLGKTEEARAAYQRSVAQQGI